MSVRVNIVINEKVDIYIIFLESIVENGDGKSIYVVEKSEVKGNEYIVKELFIIIGFEFDFNVEVLGEGILDGIFVIDDFLICKVGEKI